MADDTHSRFTTVSEDDISFKLVVGHTTKHMKHSHSCDTEIWWPLVENVAPGLCPRATFSTSGSSYFNVHSLPCTHIHTRLTALFPGLPGWASTRKLKPIWISLKQDTVSGSGISWAICKSAPRSRQITTQFFTGRMPFLPPNQQRQSTEGSTTMHHLYTDRLVDWNLWKLLILTKPRQLNMDQLATVQINNFLTLIIFRAVD